MGKTDKNPNGLPLQRRELKFRMKVKPHDWFNILKDDPYKDKSQHGGVESHTDYIKASTKIDD